MKPVGHGTLAERASGWALFVQLLRLMRPLQWVKSGFVFIGMLFDEASPKLALFGDVLLAALAFCLVSSCVYVLNDIFDLRADQSHPHKRTRPLAMLLAYVGLNLAYSAGLKHVAVLDVFLIAAGFMLRIFAGTWGVGIAPSQWLLLCGLLLTVFLGFAKRRAELLALEDSAAGDARRRPVLDEYSPALLDTMMAISAAGVVVSYSLYTVSPDTVALHHTDKLVYTLPMVLYGMLRYIFLVHRRRGEDPTTTVLSDAHMLATCLAWLCVTLWLLW